MNLIPSAMIRTFLPLLLPVALLAACSATPNSLKQENLKGPVKSVRTQTFEAESKFGEVSKGKPTSEDNTLRVYNRAGYVVEASDYLSSGELVYKHIYKYDPDNHMIEYSFYHDDGELENRVIQERENGVLKEEKVYDAEGNLEYKGVATTEDGRITRIIYYTPDGQKESETRFKWEKGNLLQQEICDSTGQVSSGWYNTYDNKGRVVVLIYKGSGGDTRYEYTRNKQGDVVQERRIEAEDIVFHSSYEYSYDLHGNWITQIYFRGEDKRPESITERTIEYF